MSGGVNVETEYHRVLADTLEEFLDFRIVPKSESRFMRLLGVLLFFNKQFMTSFVTTIGNRMWVPPNYDDWSDVGKASLLRHERVHLRQQRRYGMFRYVLMYLVWPLPFWRAKGRMLLEREAYTESMDAWAQYYGIEFLERSNVCDTMIGHFTTGEYGWMWTKRADIEKWYDDALQVIRGRH